MRNSKQLEWLENELSTVRQLADMGTDTVHAEIRVRAAMRRMVERKFLSSSSAINEEFVAQSSLLLGRLLRLRGKRSEARAWIEQSQAILTSLFEGGSVGAAEGILRCAEHLTLIAKDESIDASTRGSKLDLRQSALAARRQLEILNSGVRVSDYDDHVLEYLQRQAEITALQSDAASALAFLDDYRFDDLASERPEHNQVLRLLYRCELHTAAGSLDDAMTYAEAAASSGIVRQSSFLQIMLDARRLVIVERACDEAEAARLSMNIRRLQAIEHISEVPRLEARGDKR